MAMKKTIVALALLGTSVGALAGQPATAPSPAETATVYDVKWLTNVQPQVDSGLFYIADENNNWWDGSRTYDLRGNLDNFSFDSANAIFKGRVTDGVNDDGDGIITSAAETDPAGDADISADWELNSIVYRGEKLDGTTVEFSDSTLTVTAENVANTSAYDTTAASAAAAIVTTNSSTVNLPLATDASYIEVHITGTEPSAPKANGGEYHLYKEIYTLLTITATSVV